MSTITDGLAGQTKLKPCYLSSFPHYDCGLVYYGPVGDFHSRDDHILCPVSCFAMKPLAVRDVLVFCVKDNAMGKLG